MPATDQYWRNLPQMHKVFAGSSVVLLLATVLMMYKDESRSWRVYQRQADVYKAEKLEKELEAVRTGEYEAEVAKLESEIEAATDKLGADKNQIRELESDLNKLEGQLQILKRDSKARNAFRDKARADYDIAVRDERTAEILQKYRETFEDARMQADDFLLQAQQAEATYEAKKGELTQQNKAVTELESALAKLKFKETQLEELYANVRPEKNSLSYFKRALKQIPIIEGFDPIHKIQYDWPTDLDVGLGMATVGRVDRCRSCHVNTTSFGAGNVANYPKDEYHEPFASHPNPDLYLTSTSPHPVTEFGCTVCHDGDGSGTSFQNAEHTPANPAMASKWEGEHNWHSNHFWEYPMLPKHFQEATCIKCHHSVVELGVNQEFGPTAPTVYEGYTIIREFGCFGCHEINGYDGTTPIGPDLRLEPNTPELLASITADPNAIPGQMRKVGPSLTHVDSKTTPEFISYWTEDPQRFRPDTKMPRFFNNTNQHDAMAGVLQPIELAAIAEYLKEKSQPLQLDSPQDGYEPNIARGKVLFSQKGCLACHAHGDQEFEGIKADFGPDLTKVHEKIKPGKEGFDWLYTWVKDPTRHHPRTKMPNLYLDAEGEGDAYIDPAADITAFILEGGPKEFPPLAKAKNYLGVALDDNFTLEEAKQLGIAEGEFAGVRIAEVIQGSPAERAMLDERGEWIEQPLQEDDVLVSVGGQGVTSAEKLTEIEAALKSNQQVDLVVIRNGITENFRTSITTPLDDLVRLFLSKSLSKKRLEEAFENKQYPVTQEMYAEGKSPADFLKGDEIDLVPAAFGEVVSDADWQHRQMVYVGRKTIGRYGCYACHEIPGFEDARPIGAALQDWGRKDTSKLAFEHIHEWLHHHGDPDGGSTAERLEHAVKLAKRGSESVSEDELTEAGLYNSVITHGRAGFLWQKLRQPRSYDYKKTETKGWDERLRMPKFPFNEKQIEAVATFVLGLVAEPPPPHFQFKPDGAKGAILEGERLLTKYNCTGCHMLDMPGVEFAIDPDDIQAPPLKESDLYAFDMLKHIKPPTKGWTGEKNDKGLPILKMTGFSKGLVDPGEEEEEFMEYSYVNWDPIQLDEETLLMPGQPLIVPKLSIHKTIDGRGGDLGKWLIPRLVGSSPAIKDINEAWQAYAPPLYKEGHKVQTPWLYQFLKNPEQLRYTTVMRMPRFNMDDNEAQALADYFAAVDGVPFPYQAITPKEPAVHAEKADLYHESYPDAQFDYLTASWFVLNGAECRKCHNVGGKVIVAQDVKRGPNLQRVEDRLRPDWTQVWIHNPVWITPYTSMPVNFTHEKPQLIELFGGNHLRQIEGTVDALFNYSKMIEIHGETNYGQPEPTVAPEAAKIDAATEAPANAGDAQ